MKKYLKVYMQFLKTSIMAQMEYRSSFILSCVTESCYLLGKSLYIIVVFSAGLMIGGLNQWQVLMFIGSYVLLTGFVDAVFLQNIVTFSEYVWKGTLDTYLTKPINSLFIITTRKFDLGLGIPNFIGGIVMILISWEKCNIPITFSNVVGYIFFTLLGCLISYPIMFIPTMFCFWLVKMDALYEVTWALWDINKMPMAIYTHPIRIFGSFIIPIFIVTNYAPMWVMRMLPVSHILYEILIIPILYGIMFVMWKKALKHYSGASC